MGPAGAYVDGVGRVESRAVDSGLSVPSMQLVSRPPKQLQPASERKQEALE